MSGLDWHPRYHRAALDGMRRLSLEERGAYNTLLDLMYDRGGPVPDDERWLAGWMGVSVRRWKAIREALISEGKIVASGEGKDAVLSNPRAASELENQSARRKSNAENGAKGGEKSGVKRRASKENSDLGEATAEAKSKLKTETGTETDYSEAIASGAEPPFDDPDEQAFEEIRALDPAKRSWRALVFVLGKRGRLNDAKARTFIGKLVKDFSLTAEELWALAEDAWKAGTEAPQPYLIEAARAVATRRPAEKRLALAIDAPSHRQQVAWMEDWRASPASWRTHERGPKPGQQGCRINPEIQTQFGVQPFGTSPPEVGGDLLPFPVARSVA